MRIYGLDFTSVPSRRKPITCASCILNGPTLRLDRINRYESFETFEQFLQTDGPWVAGFDFPFGQPSVLIERLGWPSHWEGYVQRVSRLDKEEFANVIKDFRDSQPKGCKHLYRPADKITKSCSPMMMYGVPVAKMFYQGAPRLMRSGVSVIPCRPNRSNRIALETYPGVLARKFVSTSYKNESKDSPERLAARKALVQVLQSKALRDMYGCVCSLGNHVEAMISDHTGDTLDSVLCAGQAAWAHAHPGQLRALARQCDPREGCIIDPVCCAAGE